MYWKSCPPYKQKKKKNVFLKFPENATRILSGTTARDDYRTPAQFLVQVAAMCATMPPPKLRASSGFAFDTVNLTCLWKVLKKLGIPDNKFNIIISFHDSIKASVMSEGEWCNSFPVTNGTKQGCSMAPVLFALYFSVMLHFAFGVRFDFRTSGGFFNHQRFKAKTLTRPSIIRDLLFADDAALVATSVRPRSTEAHRPLFPCF